jgi:putative sterol carrier protein
VIGEPTDSADGSPDVQEIYFGTVARSARTEAVAGQPFTVQWRFSDADPWHVVVDNGSTRAERGEAGRPNVTLETSWRDFIAVSSGELHPGRAMLGRRMRLRGRVRDLLRFRRLFPGSRARS